MEVELRTVTGADEARAHLDILQRAGRAALVDLGLPEAPEDFIKRFLETQFEAPETLLLIAETSAGSADIGFVLVGPHTDPLSGGRTPMVLILSVDSKMRHRGLATTLIQEARRVMKRRGYDQLAARCPHGEDALISIGERWGFVRSWEFLMKE
jgi:GNAT superfamily N-acetyltransferase